jgi:LysR family transcriptional regulator, benzoate and cis,cis-muconate-responsive activator of ben and cat genes
MDLDLSCVASFLVLLHEGSYGRAAAVLHLSQSALSKRMQRLEHQIGVALVIRDATGVTGTTPAGARFAEHAPALLAAARAAEDAARAAAPFTVCLGVHGPVGDWPERRVLVELERRLRQRYPDVRLACRSIPLSATNACVLDGSVDVMWGAFAQAPAAIETTPLLELERIAVVTAEHDLADAGVVHAEDLARTPIAFIPGAEPEVMSAFVLGDVRPLRHATLIESPGQYSRSLMRALEPGQAAIIGASTWPASVVKPGLRDLRIVDLPLIPMYVGRRRSDRRGPVRTLAALLPEIAAEFTGDPWSAPRPGVSARAEAAGTATAS